MALNKLAKKDDFCPQIRRNLLETAENIRHRLYFSLKIQLVNMARVKGLKPLRESQCVKVSVSAFGSRNMVCFRHLLRVLSGLVLLGVPLAADAETLNDALARAYHKNPHLNAQRASSRAVGEDLARASSGFLPRVNATSSVGQRLTSGNTGSTDSAGYDYATSPRTLGVVISQNIYDGDRTKIQVELARQNIEGAEFSLRSAETQVLLAAATAYMDVVRDQAVIALRASNIMVLKEQLKQVNNRRKAGDATQTDVAQVEAQLAAGEVDLSSASANLEMSKATYFQVIGSEPENLTEPSPAIRQMPNSLKDALQLALKENPKIQASKLSSDIAKSNVEAVEAEYKPTLTIQASATKAWEKFYPGDQEIDFRIWGQMTGTIYEAGEIAARVRSSKERLAQSKNEAESAIDQVKTDIIDSWSQIQAATDRVKSAKAQISSAQTALNGVKAEAKAGQRTTIDVLVSNQNLLNAQVNFVNARRDRVVSSYRLLSSMGRLSASGLGLAVKIEDGDLGQ